MFRIRNFLPLVAALVGAAILGVPTQVRAEFRLSLQEAGVNGGAVFHVGDEDPGRGVLLAAQQGEMNLPQIFEMGRVEQHVHRRRLSAFAGSVVHDRDPRPNRVDQRL